MIFAGFEYTHEKGYGPQRKFKFDNDYGASMIREPYTCGGSKRLWEIAVLGPNGHLNYSTPITSDVLRHLTESEAVETLTKISLLPPKG